MGDPRGDERIRACAAAISDLFAVASDEARDAVAEAMPLGRWVLAAVDEDAVISVLTAPDRGRAIDAFAPEWPVTAFLIDLDEQRAWLWDPNSHAQGEHEAWRGAP